MNKRQLEIMHTGKGFIAALDQSGGSTPKALRAYGIPEEAYTSEEEMFNLVHHMRTRIINAEAFNSDKILGAILFENTMDRKIEDLYTADYLWNKKGVIPFLKIDKGLAEEKNGVRMFKPMPELDSLLDRAAERHIFGTKERTVINKADKVGIAAIVKEQFEVGMKVVSHGFVPILEPEVTITIPDKAEAEAILKDEIDKNLAMLPAEAKIMLKLSLPSKDGFYDELAADQHVVRIVALSGGYTREEANHLLKKNKKMIASFSRALTQGLNVNQSQEEFEQVIGKTIDSIYDASVNK